MPIQGSGSTIIMDRLHGEVSNYKYWQTLKCVRTKESEARPTKQGTLTRLSGFFLVWGYVVIMVLEHWACNYENLGSNLGHSGFPLWVWTLYTWALLLHPQLCWFYYSYRVWEISPKFGVREQTVWDGTRHEKSQLRKNQRWTMFSRCNKVSILLFNI